MDGLLGGMNVMVTGASRGIGRAIALEAARQGANVVVCASRPRPEADETARMVRARGRRAWVATGDLGTMEGCRSTFRQAVEAAGSLDALVNNAGTASEPPFLDADEEDWNRTHELNAKSGFFLTQWFARHSIDAGRGGKVVFVSSVNGFQAERWSPCYDSSKAAQLQLVRSLACSLAEHGINVNGIAPGMIYTDLTCGGPMGDPATVEFYEKHIPLGRVGTPEDCGGAAVFLCSPLADYITGETIVIDGGLTVEQLPPPFRTADKISDGLAAQQAL